VSKSVSFSLTEAERGFFAEYARRKGLTLSALAKQALFQYEARHPLKGMSVDSYEVSPSAVQQSTPDGD